MGERGWGCCNGEGLCLCVCVCACACLSESVCRYGSEYVSVNQHKKVVVEESSAGGAVKDCLLKVIPNKVCILQTLLYYFTSTVVANAKVPVMWHAKQKH